MLQHHGATPGNLDENHNVLDHSWDQFKSPFSCVAYGINLCQTCHESLMERFT